ncbi:MAG: TMEM175 family protein [Actinomycetota bacterium]|nr:TMEM175 family protein [Actinomycetota bacterium]MDQ2958646.1 TMEM175 family protein [Actinomycetota bacterium]
MSEDEQVGHRSPRDAGSEEPEDNSLGRLLALSDGIFAIAMTLLTLSLAVPDVGTHPSDASLRHALAANSDSYLSFLLTFSVIAGYWNHHRRLMRSVVRVHPVLVRDTLFLLVLISAMPFPASLLGRYGGLPISLALYGAFNALATLALMMMKRDVRRLRLIGVEPSADNDGRHRSPWQSLVVFLLCIPGGYLLGHHGPYLLLLLIPVPAASLIRKARHLASWRPSHRRLP